MVDEFSETLFPNDSPVASPFRPFTTTGNGSCLFNGVLTALAGMTYNITFDHQNHA